MGNGKPTQDSKVTPGLGALGTERGTMNQGNTVLGTSQQCQLGLSDHSPRENYQQFEVHKGQDIYTTLKASALFFALQESA